MHNGWLGSSLWEIQTHYFTAWQTYRLSYMYSVMWIENPTFFKLSENGNCFLVAPDQGRNHEKF